MSNIPEMEVQPYRAITIELEKYLKGDLTMLDLAQSLDHMSIAYAQAEKEKALRELVEEIKTWLAGEEPHTTYVEACLARALGKGEDGTN